MANERKGNLFREVPIPKTPRNMFDLSHEVKMSGKFGFLYPVLLMDCLPGDTVRDTTNVFMRFAPLLAPVLHRCDVTMHFFFVPMRLLTDVWEDFITGGQDGTAAPVLPYLTPGNVYHNEQAGLMQKGSLWDYLGLPVWDGVVPADWSDEQVSVLPFRAAAKVWNDFYRDPNLDEEMNLNENLEGDVSVASRSNGILDISNYRRGFEKDYFTSALTQAQRGAELVAPGTDITYKSPTNVLHLTQPAASQPYTITGNIGPNDSGHYEGVYGYESNIDGGEGSAVIDNLESVGFLVNDLRRTLAVQRWMENNSRGGARYVEQIENHFNVRVPDYRLQRAEYLGGGKQPVQISEVLATAEGAATEVGDMAGHGISVGRTNTFTYRCQEHGFIIGFMSVTMRTAYMQGIPRMFSRQDKFDFGWPELAHLGEQEVVNKEVFYSFDGANDADNIATFGYIPRYAEYKFMNDRVAGDFRTTLGYWHLVRNFTSRPVLDSSFTTIHEDGGDYEETFRRIFAVQDGTDYLWFQLFHKLTAKRPLPYFGVPRII